MSAFFRKAIPAVLLSAGTLLLSAATRPATWHWDIPSWAPAPVVPSDNPMTAEKVALGRRLFYDKRLSENGTLACASCHLQKLGFASGVATHAGAHGEPGLRAPMPLANVAYLPSYTWANPQLTTLEKQMLIPMFGDQPVELGMGGQEKALFARLSGDPCYARLFRAAFPEAKGAITLSTVTKAIASFERTLLSFDSPYDRSLHGDKTALSPAAQRGEALFFGEKLECSHCHNGLNLTDNIRAANMPFPETGFHNTGLYNEDGKGAYPTGDHGLRTMTGNADDEGKFRTESLRNVALTGPYMHDGSIATLHDVLAAHYSKGGRSATGPHGENPLRDQFIEPFDISEAEIADVIAFLNALTDQGFLTNPAFSDPGQTCPVTLPSDSPAGKGAQ